MKVHTQLHQTNETYKLETRHKNKFLNNRVTKSHRNKNKFMKRETGLRFLSFITVPVPAWKVYPPWPENSSSKQKLDSPLH